jgi:hypothetical protein
MGLDNIIVLVLIVGAIGALVAINLHSRRKNKQAKSNPESGE